jgi:thymidylate synthase (FAD)
VRHRTAKLNEISGRYSVMKDEFYLPEGDAIAFQSTDNKQGRSSEAVPDEVKAKVRDLLEKGQRQSFVEYESLLEEGVARELARINLPVSLYTEWYWTMDLHNLFHFLALRLDAHAQLEIRKYAEVILDLTRAVAPIAVESFENNLLGGVRFNRQEWEALRKLVADRPEAAEAALGPDVSAKAKERFLVKLKDGRQL